VLAQAFGNAKINIVGGDGAFFDRFVRAISLGQSVEGVLGQSDTVKSLVEGLLAPGPTGPAGEGASSVTLASVLEKLMSGADDTSRTKLQALAKRSKELGLDQLLPR
jgi:hypothetical protein